MKTLTVNRNNWSGEMGEIKLLANNRFRIEDITGVFTMKEETLSDEYGELGKVYIVTDPEGWTYKGYGAVDFHTKKFNVIFQGPVLREHENPFVSFAQLAWNIF